MEADAAGGGAGGVFRAAGRLGGVGQDHEFVTERSRFVDLEAVDQAFAREQAGNEGQIALAVLNGVAAVPALVAVRQALLGAGPRGPGGVGLPSTLRYVSASRFTRTVDCGDTKHCYFIGLEIGVFNLISTRIATVGSVLYILTRNFLTRNLQPNSLIVT